MRWLKVTETKEEKPKDDGIIKIEELMFQVDGEGKAQPQKVPLVIYDRQLDQELLEEAMVLDRFIKERDSMMKMYVEFCAKADEILKSGESKYKKFVEEKKITELEAQETMDKNKASIELEKIREHRKYIMIVESINQSRFLIKKLKERIKEQKVVSQIKAIPMNNAESSTVLTSAKGKQGKKPTGEDSTDWVNDMILYCVKEPLFDEKTVKFIKPNEKIAMKETILEISGLKTTNYKDVLIQNTNMSEKKETTPIEKE